ncbi:hypothetical protein AB6A40_006500 [Gnathostoma spinigerum]|uniref:Uncharacterized protein n=1 Tax=Gnathostoma spinigerum TaxID=75299 RepID=A0ABD6EJ65_9BILA
MKERNSPSMKSDSSSERNTEKEFIKTRKLHYDVVHDDLCSTHSAAVASGALTVFLRFLLDPLYQSQRDFRSLSFMEWPVSEGHFRTLNYSDWVVYAVNVQMKLSFPPSHGDLIGSMLLYFYEEITCTISYILALDKLTLIGETRDITLFVTYLWKH